MRRVAAATTLVSLAVVTPFAVPVLTGWAGALPNPTPSSPLLQAPTEVSYDETANVVRWTDTNDNEEGYRVTVAFGDETRAFETAPNVEAIQLPAEFRPGCPAPGPNVSIEVVAFLGGFESEPGTFGFAALCPIATLTPAPQATETPLPVVVLPKTGVGDSRPPHSGLAPVATLLVVAVVASGAAAVMAIGPRR